MANGQLFITRHVCLAIAISLCTLMDAYGSTGFYADNGLEQSVIVDRMMGRKRQDMQLEILTLLGLHHRPKPKSHGTENSAPKFMLDLYKTLKTEGIDFDDVTRVNHELPSLLSVTNDAIKKISGSDVIMSFVNHANKIHYLRHERDRTFYFDFLELPPHESVTGAELRLYKSKPKKRIKEEQYQLQLYMIKQGRDPEDKMLDWESNLTVSWNFQGWFNLNASRAAEFWAAYPSANMGLYLRVKGASGHEVSPDRFGISGRRGSRDEQSFLVGFFKMTNEVHSRRKRSARRRNDVSYSDDPNATGQQKFVDRISRRPSCQRKNLHVSFRDLGWKDWVIAPEGYPAYYCAGECAFPLGAHMNATNHAIVQTLVHLQNPRDAPMPCCAPTRLSPINMLYFDDNSNVVLKKYKNMVVRSCGCH